MYFRSTAAVRTSITVSVLLPAFNVDLDSLAMFGMISVIAKIRGQKVSTFVSMLVIVPPSGYKHPGAAPGQGCQGSPQPRVWPVDSSLPWTTPFESPPSHCWSLRIVPKKAAPLQHFQNIARFSEALRVFSVPRYEGSWMVGINEHMAKLLPDAFTLLEINNIK